MDCVKKMEMDFMKIMENKNCGKRSKGQAFLIIATVAIIVLVMLKTSLGLIGVIENKKYLETKLGNLEFGNARRELIKTLQVSYSFGNITRNVEETAKFSKYALAQRGTTMKGIFIETVYPNISASTDALVNVTVLNMLGDPLSVLNVELNGSVRNYTSVRDSESVLSNFTINTASDASYLLSVSYTTPESTENETVAIPVRIGHSKFVGLFDLRLVIDRIEQRDKFTKTITLP